VLGLPRGRRVAVALVTWLALAAGAPGSHAQPAPPAGGEPRIAVLPFQVFSARPQGYLEQSLADLLTTRLEASGRVRVLEAAAVRESVVAHAGERTEATVRRIARDVGADQVVAGSLTELAGRYSLDVKVVPAEEEAPARTLVFTAEGEPQLLDRVNELADRVLEVAGGASPAGQVAEVRVEGVDEALAAELPKRLRLRRGATYESSSAREDLRTLREVPGIAAADVETERGPQGVVVTYRLVPAERLIPAASLEKPGDVVADVQVRGNRRIEANAIKARVGTKPGQPYNPATVAADVREIYGLGFFRNVRVLEQKAPSGRVLVFEVEENPVVRQVTVTGNENIDGDKIRDTLTLTTGSTLDYPLLFENRERVEALYRAQGYYLARVTHRIEEISADAVSIDFEVNEGEKLPLDRIRFEGNQHFSQEDLEDALKTRRRRWYSPVTKYLDKSGTYSEPVFIQDLQKLNEKYTDDGYIQVEIGDPRVTVVEDDRGNDALAVEVEIREGLQYRVGSVDVQGDPSLDLDALRERVRLKEGDVFNRSSLTADVEDLERYYTDRGFFYASVSPRTRLEESDLTVDVDFDVQKGDLHFIREIDVTGNTNTVDEVIRREMRVVEGQLYTARGVNRSRDRVKRLGFFEDVEFEAKATDYQEQLDLDLKVVERPTGSLSFGVGYSTQDSLVVSGSVSQSNLFGRGYGVQAVVDYGSRNSQFYLSFYNPYLLDSEFSLRTTAFRTDLEYIDFEQTELGVEISLGHDLNEEGTARGNLRYSYATRDIERLTTENAAAMIFRELLSDENSTSLFGVSWVSDTRDDYVAPKSGHVYGANLEYAGLGGFAEFVRLEGRALWFVQPPDWFPAWFPFRDDSTFVFGVRAGYTLPFNSVSDYSFDVPTIATGEGSEVQPLDNIDTDLELPLSERYFLGGLGSYQLRGYRARSVGPRRALLQRTGAFGLGSFFTPVGRSTAFAVEGDELVFDAFCNDSRNVFGNQGDGDGRCNSLYDEDIDDFDDLDETDVIGGNKFISASVEYRFPVSKELGLVGIVFLDMGNAFDETQNLWDVGEFRFGTGIGALWFSPFGPLQAFVGFPLNKLEVEDSTTFEFSVGGSAY
jgi:outer membrane protein insertion porin family